MTLKIFHASDLHIGMKFANYPEPVKSQLKQARLEVLGKMVDRANQEGCQIFAISGDLFQSISGIQKKTLTEVVGRLKGFHGECILVLPGNHDYDNPLVDLWKGFQEAVRGTLDNLILLEEDRPYSLADYDLNATVYPAPCRSKHSDTNNLGWIKEADMDPSRVNIGMAHGALEGISPDLDQSYYNMSPRELESIPVDVWLLGHTHITYPDKTPVTGWKVFNPGTPEPDGLDCRHGGHAWLLTIQEDKEVQGEQFTTGTYQFKDETRLVRSLEDLENIKKDLLKEDPGHTIARLRIQGKLEEEAFHYRHEIRRALEESLAYLQFDDSGLGIKITPEMIQKEFSEGSFPAKLLSSLSKDEEALQLAYELIQEVRR